MTMRRAALAAFFLLAPLGMAATGWAAARSPALEIEAPPFLAATAQRLRELPPGAFDSVVQLTGLEVAGPPIRVVLAPEASETARQVPSWYSGYAAGDRGLVVLFPSRALSYPDSTLPDLLRHEVAHVLAAR